MQIIVEKPEPAWKMPDYGRACADFSWAQARSWLGGAGDGSGLNMASNCLDRHVLAGRGAEAALLALRADGRLQRFSFAELLEASCRFSAVLRRLEVGQGDSVALLCGRIPETWIALLGTLRLGAVAAPLFSAFGPDPLLTRLRKARARVLVTDLRVYHRRVAALRDSLPELRHVLLVDGAAGDARDLRVLMAGADSHVPCHPSAPDAPALLHFTSGTTGDPKAAVHGHEALVAHMATGRLALDLGPGDRYWCTADPGWVTGISYGVLAPLACGATAIVDEGELDPARWYDILEQQRVNVWYTAPTAIRMLMRFGTGAVHGRDFSALRLVASVGEPLGADAVAWGQRQLGRPIRDTWWQTETGAIMIGSFPGLALLPGAMGKPFPGIRARLVQRLPGGGLGFVDQPGTTGEIALAAGWPSMFRTYLGEERRYEDCFREGWYLSGDLARCDAAGYFHFVGRADDVIKTAGHLVGPFEVEQVLTAQPQVNQAAVIGVPDPVVGQLIKAFVVPAPGFRADNALKRHLLAAARRALGPAVAPRSLGFVERLPHNRSGKIMRRLLRARELGLPEGDLSTLEGEDGGGR